MSHSSHELDADESRLNTPGPGTSASAASKSGPSPPSPGPGPAPLGRWVSIQGPEPDAGPEQPNI